MKPEVMTEEEWREAGLKGVRLGSADVIDLPTDAPAQGDASTVAVREALPRHAPEFPYLPVASRAAKTAGLRLRWRPDRPGVFLVSGPRHTPLWASALRRTRGERKWCSRPPDEPGILYLDLNVAPVVAVFLPDQAGVALCLRGRTVEVRPFAPQPAPASPPPTPEPAPPLQEWAESTHDQWLKNDLRRRVKLPPWLQVVGAGIAASLEEPAPGAGDRIAALLRGEQVSFPGIAEAARQWAAALPAAERESLGDLAQARVDFLLARIEGLQETMRPARQWWLEELHAVCLERDDLARVGFVLNAAEARGEKGPAARLADALALVDRIGEELIDSLPCTVTIRDERLWRAAIVLPDEWWTRLAAPPEDAPS